MWNDSRGMCERGYALVSNENGSHVEAKRDTVNPPHISEGSSDAATLQVIAEQEIKRINNVA